MCGFCGGVQGVDEEPWGRAPAALGAGWVGVDAAQVAVLLQQGQGGVEVGGLGEPAAGGSRVGIPTRELRLVGAADPVQEPAGVVDLGAVLRGSRRPVLFVHLTLATPIQPETSRCIW